MDLEFSKRPSRPAVQLLLRLAYPHRHRIALLLALAIAQALLAAGSPRLVGMAVDTGVPAARHHNYYPLFGIGIALAVCAAGLAVLGQLWRTLAGKIGQRVVYELRCVLFDKVQRMSVSFHERSGSGNVIAPLTSDMEMVNTLFSTALAGLLQAAVGMVVTTAAMLLLDPGLALITLAVLAPFTILSAWNLRQLTAAFKENRASIADMTVHVIESLNGIRVIHAFRRMNRNNEIFTALTERTRRSGRRIQIVRAAYWPIVELLLSSAALVVVAVGGLRVINGGLEVGVLAAFVLYSAQFTQPIMNMSSFLDTLQSALTALGKIAKLMKEEASVPEPIRPSRIPEPLKGELVLEDIQFAYRGLRSNNTEKLKLEIDRLTLQLRPGETVALLGATGAGKSTIAKLIARFYDPLAGRILLDGVDLRHLSEGDLRRAIVMLTQEVFLFSGSIADNIRISRPTATDAEVEAAARAMGVHSFIQALPDGYQTEVRKRGGRLSAGQRQMVAFARAFLADPVVLILDEATSALDIPTERAMQTALRTLLAGRTGLIIAHRLSTVEIADRVLVVSDGHIVDDGTPAELLMKGSAEFAALYRDGRGLSLKA